MFREKSNILTLSAEEQYLGLRRCGNSDILVDQMDCLQIMGLRGTDGDIPSTDGSLVMPMSSFNLPLPPTTGGPVEEPGGGGKNLAALYTVITVIVVFTMLITLLLIVLVILRRNISFKPPLHEDMDGQPEQQQVAVEHQSHAPQTSPVNQNEAIDLNENVAYHTMGKIKLNENISYATSMPHRPATALYYEELDNANT